MAAHAVLPLSMRQIALSENLSEIREVFLSATATDVHCYRCLLRDAIRLQKIELFLQEDWPEGAMNIVPLCRARLYEKSDAYVGNFGFRYGWIPPGETESITQLECRWALDRWPGDQPCPVFIFLPEPHRRADKYLRNQANRVLRDEFCDLKNLDADKECNESLKKQKEFHSWLRGYSRRIQWYKNDTDLCVRSVTSINHWNREILLRAPKKRKHGGAKEIPLSLLGAIDHSTQQDALVEALSALGDQPEAPGSCLLVHGADGMGQFEFLSFLANWFITEWDLWMPVAHVHEPILRQPQQNATALLRAAFAQLAPRQQPGEDLVTAVAKASLDSCADRPTILLISDINAIDGGIAAFHADFWKPLYLNLRAVRQGLIHKHRLIVIATCSEDLSASFDSSLSEVISKNPGGSLLDYEKLLPLPRLEAFKVADVNQWLRDAVSDWLSLIGESRKPLGTTGRAILANMVTARGGLPRLVYEEIRRTRLWSDQD